MVRSLQHEMLATRTSDEAARQDFVLALKRAVNREMRPRNRALYDKVAAPAFAEKTGAAPASRAEARAALMDDERYQGWSALARTAQEMMWDSVATPILREEHRLRETYRRLATSNTRLGSLTLDPGCAPPRALVEENIHCQPGGYLLDRDGEDVVAGALYEAGGNLYAFGAGIGATDSKAARIIRHLGEAFPDFAPRRILDMGCSAGSASCEYPGHFPAAEVHAIDVGAAMLRYAHARAEALGVGVHFHQMDVASTGFEDGSFDLVVSHNLMHEISAEGRRGAFRESFRLLRPGGIAIHQDVPLRFAGLPLYDQAEFNWDKEYNGEPFWDTYADGDIAGDLADAGFDPAQVSILSLDKLHGPGTWFVAQAIR